MRYSKNSTEVFYLNKKACHNEKCYCVPFVSPLEIAHTITLDKLRKIICNEFIDSFDIIDVRYVNLAQNFQATIPNTEYIKITTTENIQTQYLQLTNFVPLDCFFLILDIIVYVNGNILQIANIITEPYCQHGTSCIQTGFVDLISAAPVDDDAVVLYSNGCTGKLGDCINKTLQYNLNTGGLFPLTLFFWVDTSIFGEIVSINNIPVTTASLECRTSKLCSPHFRIKSSLENGIDCNGDYHFVGFQELPNNTTWKMCFESVKTILGITQVLPISTKTSLVEDTCIITGRTSTEAIRLFSTNEANIPTWALNEISVLLNAKSVRVVDFNNSEVDVFKTYNLRNNQDDIYVFGVESRNDKYLTVTLESCDCEQYFGC